MRVRLGGVLPTDPDPDAVYASVSHVILHTDYRNFRRDDIGLLRLTSPVQYTDTILPICLPSPTVNLDQFKVCVDSGFGRTSINGLSMFVSATAECTVMTYYLLRPISHHFRDKRRFPSKIANFSHLRVYIAPAEGVVPIGIGYRRRGQKNLE